MGAVPREDFIVLVVYFCKPQYHMGDVSECMSVCVCCAWLYFVVIVICFCLCISKAVFVSVFAARAEGGPSEGSSCSGVSQVRH